MISGWNYQITPRFLSRLGAAIAQSRGRRTALPGRFRRERARGLQRVA